MKSNFLFLTLLAASFSVAQVNNPFKKRYQNYIKGDIAVLANNVVNRADANSDPTVPFDNHTNHAMMNDQYEMFYIDTDKDAETFCSTSANLSFDTNTQKKIVYAALYWSGTYKYNKGLLTKANKFIPSDAKRTNFNTVKLKLPGNEQYLDIKGKIIYDGIYQKEVAEFAPYTVYADITKYVNDLKDPSGTYTVANVKATQGMLSGGTAAGWTIFVVYEDTSLTGKFITTFDGFAGVTEDVTDVKFDGFQTLPEGKINAKIVCAALEGDMGLSGDQLLFKTKASNTFVPLSTSIRKPNNFFSGCITNENNYVLDRVPNSKNTLGYDTCLLTIPNENNSVIANNTNEAVIRLKSTGDRYFMFFTAYCVDVTEPTQEAIASMQKSNEERLKEATAEVLEVPTIEPAKEVKVAEIIPVKEEPKVAAIQNIEKVTPTVETPVINKAEIKQEVKQVTKAEIKQEVKKQVLADKEEIKNSILKGMKEDLIAELKREIEAEIKDEVRSEVKAEIKEEFKKEYKKQLKKELKDQLKSDLAESLTNNNSTTVVESKPTPSSEPATIVPADKEEIPVATTTNANKPSIVYEKLDTVYSGFYLVANVFSNPINASKFIKNLEKQGLKPNSFYNNTAKLTYVYLAKVENEEEANKLYESKMNGAYQDPMWILVIIKEKK